MNLDLKTIQTSLKPVLAKLGRYLSIIVIVTFVSMYGYLLLKINSLTSAKPSDQAITEKLKTVQRPRVDEKAAEKMQQLEDQNVSVQTLFNDARQNPFAE